MIAYKPVSIADGARLLSTTAVEAYPAWASAKYWQGDRVVSGDAKQIYQALPALETIQAIADVDTGASRLHIPNHGLAANDPIRFKSSSSNLNANWGMFYFLATYYVVAYDTDYIRVSITPGGASLSFPFQPAATDVFVRTSPANSPDPQGAGADQWTLVGPSNKWAMFGANAGVQTTAPLNLTVSIKPGAINALAMFGLVGQFASVSITDGVGGPVVYTSTVDLDASSILDAYDFFFAPFDQRTEFALIDIPPGYGNGVVTVTLSGAVGVGVGVSNLLVGFGRNIGGLQWSPSRSMKSYSAKEENAFGTVSVTKRGFKRLLSGKINIPNDRLNAINGAFEAYRDELCVWIGTDIAKFSSATLLYGFYLTFNEVIAFDDYTFCDIQIEGVTQ